MNTITKTIKRIAALGAVLLTGVLAEAQVTPGSYVPLCSATVLTNGSTTTLNTSTNVSQNSESIQMMAIIGPNAANSPTNGWFCTNIVLKFNYLIGTNVTTDTPFTWTIATDVFGAMSQTAATNPICVWTNLTSKRGLTGIQLATALPSSTNTVGPKLTVLVGRTP